MIFTALAKVSEVRYLLRRVQGNALAGIGMDGSRNQRHRNRCRRGFSILPRHRTNTY